MRTNTLPAPVLIPADQLAVASPIPVTILPDVPALDAHFAAAVADEIATNNQRGTPTVATSSIEVFATVESV